MKIDRKQFIKLLWALLFLPFAWLWSGMISRQKLYAIKSEPFKISSNLPEGITFAGSYIISRTNDNLKVFSARCTHLGCLINKEEGGQLVCPCHGSHFSPFTGDVLKGPAAIPLKEMQFSIDKTTDQLIIQAV